MQLKHIKGGAFLLLRERSGHFFESADKYRRYEALNVFEAIRRFRKAADAYGKGVMSMGKPGMVERYL